MNQSVLSDAAKVALTFIVATGSASGQQLRAAAVAASRPSFMDGLPLAGMIGAGSVPEDLEALGLIQRTGLRYFATVQGRNMVAFLSALPPEPSVQVADEPLFIVGSPSDPVFYADILSALSRMDEVMIVDPFLAAVDLRTMSQVGKLTRVLTGATPVADRGETRGDKAARLTSLRINAGITPHVEVRLTSAIHDRYALPRVGAGYMLGASMGSKKLTTMIQLSEVATQTLLEAHETIWSTSERIKPIVSTPNTE